MQSELLKNSGPAYNASTTQTAAGSVSGASPVLREPARPSDRRPPASDRPEGVWHCERWLMRKMLSALGNPPIAIVPWDGEEVACGNAPVLHRVRIGDRRTLWRIAVNPLYQFPEAYAEARVAIDGRLDDFLADVYCYLDQARKRGPLSDRMIQAIRRPNGTSRSKSRHNIHHHYDLGNDFYRLWLDEKLLYTCAYFPHPGVTLEQAQLAKMDHVCRKLRLQPGMSVVEAGCGWGAFALHMAQNYNVKVRAYNISQEQIKYARAEAVRQGLDGQVEFILDDWRNISDPCDAFVSIGMLEHVGTKNYQRLGSVIDRCLPEGALGLVHFIGQDFPAPFSRWIERRIFPGAYPPALSEATRLFEPHDFSILDVENLRPHYALTLTHWLQRFEDNKEAVRAMFDDRFVRMWRMYLAGSTAGFRAGGLQLFQILFSKGQAKNLPWTRDYIYRDCEPANCSDGMCGNGQAKTY